MMELLESRAGLFLLDPWLLLLFLLVPAALWMRARRGRPAIRFAPGPLLFKTKKDGGVPSSLRVRLLHLPRWLQIAGLFFLVAALARPVHRIPLPFETEGIDIILCLDTSSSMTADDMDQSRTRMEVAKEAAAQFISQRPADRIGLICFARYPDVACPLTLDHAALQEILGGAAAKESDSPEDATGIGAAVARAAQVLGSGEASSRVVILLTDGEENVATDQTPDEIAPLHAAQLCEKMGVRVYTIAAGTGRRDASGRWTRIDTSQVKHLAERTGGRCFEARDASAAAGVYGYIDRLEKTRHDEPRYRIEEEFLPFLFAALALLVASRLLESTVLEVQP